MVSDQEPRYRLVDDNGNIVGSLYGKADGSVAIQETDSGDDREVALAPDGTFSAPSVETESVTTESLAIAGLEQFERFDEIDIPDDTTGATPTISITNPGRGKQILFKFAVIRTRSSVEIRMTADGAEDGDYWYQLYDGEKQSGSNYLTIQDDESFGAGSGLLLLTMSDESEIAAHGFMQDSSGDAEFVERGGISASDDITEITFELPDPENDTWSNVRAQISEREVPRNI